MPKITFSYFQIFAWLTRSNNIPNHRHSRIFSFGRWFIAIIGEYSPLIFFFSTGEYSPFASIDLYDCAKNLCFIFLFCMNHRHLRIFSFGRRLAIIGEYSPPPFKNIIFWPMVLVYNILAIIGEYFPLIFFLAQVNICPWH